MTPPPSPTAAGLVSTQAREALLRGDRGASRRLALEALGHDPSCDLAWLILAALSPPARRRAYPQHGPTPAPNPRRFSGALACTAAGRRRARPPATGRRDRTPGSTIWRAISRPSRGTTCPPATLAHCRQDRFPAPRDLAPAP